MEIDREVAENYRQLRDERGWSWAQMAEHYAGSDRKLSAWMRGQATPTPVEAPKARRSAARNEA